MKIDKNYAEFIQSIKKQIVQSRYAAARLANREQLLLYFNTGKMISDKIKAQKWGAKVLDQISADLQMELPGLKEFSPGNLKKIRVFAEAHSPHLTIGSTPKERENEIQIRPVEKMVDRLLAMDNRSLTIARPVEKRLICLCRNFGLLLLSMLRAKNIPARGRCGYATYLIPDYFETHWICEYWDATEDRWKLVDVQLDEIFQERLKIDFDILDIPRDQFIVVGDAWNICQSRKADSRKFGYIPGHLQGLWHIAMNLVRDIATLNKVETLSWDIGGLNQREENKLLIIVLGFSTI